jgi:hypothetical protein
MGALECQVELFSSGRHTPRALGPRTERPVYDISAPSLHGYLKAVEKFHIDIAPGYDFDVVGLVRPDNAGLPGACEGARYEFLDSKIIRTPLMPVTDSFRRLWDAIRDPAFGCNLDCGWAMNQREYPQ